MDDFWKALAKLNPIVARRLRALIEDLLPGSPSVAVVLFFDNGGPTVGAITVRDTDAPFGASVSFLDAKGATTQPDDVPQWSSDNEDAATVEASDDGMSATITPGNPGAAVIEVTSTDNDGTVVTSQGTVTVQPGEAVIGDVEFSAGG